MTKPKIIGVAQKGSRKKGSMISVPLVGNLKYTELPKRLSQIAYKKIRVNFFIFFKIPFPRFL